ncbi:protein of unknown function [Taphrina deformans PYCC 5710]|uniref:SAM-dependent MTase RsmB/NOP-type domain-containing protein n=1 Tax=Taphrina deformans (strain PYCC 5710 / ATCC 11124 / CBS 356.35 / IMI 108563 / JCM 9778 / NBRC 8474) TaxID=1097556 RepID=R4XFT2_TAPDE|nr:protein of unknown function [Taphrina deformans PYCC 5710]|eukprot:CCG84528.1 protein of unknown function [Taphrina deformans PYCC 5710]
MDFYIQASAILTKLNNKAGSIKGLTLLSGEKNGPRLYALILETLKYRDVLQQVIESSQILIKERKLAAQGNLPLVLIHDLLLNKGGIVANSGPFKDAVLRHKTRLQAEWIKAKIKLKVKDNTQLAKVDATFIPRWARINTLRITKEEMMLSLGNFAIVQSLDDLSLGHVYVDEHIANLLAFHPQQVLTNNKHYLDGSLIFQNKASCIPAVVLDPPLGTHVIDACAAPGNKTSHLAALLAGTGKVFAFERDDRRVNVLRSMLTKADAKVEVTHGDFTRTDPHDPKYAVVTHLLLDPSCSGSGIVNRLDYLTASPATTTAAPLDKRHARDDGDENDGVVVEGTDGDRLASLATFQQSLLLHAMSFPRAERVTYSTCSVHPTENEHVVMAVLRRRPDWTVAGRADTLPRWPTRGLPAACGGDAELAAGLIRAEPGALGTIGFFVASFVKRDSVADREGRIQKKKRKKKKKQKKEKVSIMAREGERRRVSSITSIRKVPT